MTYTEETLDFLFQNRVMDSREWFREHREEYDRLVLEPTRELVQKLAPAMLKIDPYLNCEPKVGRCISRIFRDTRFSKDKHIYRDVVWICFFRRRELYHGLPGFFFEFSPMGMRWGCGYYQASPETIQAARELMLAGDERFLKAQELMAGQKKFRMEDARYKRSRHPDQPEALRQWLDQRNYCAITESTKFELLYSEKLADRLAADFKKLKPLYEFLMAAEARKDHSRNKTE